MKLSTRGDYAVRALLELATEGGADCITLGKLAGRTGIPPKYLEQILMRLRHERVIDARRGARGGYRLARPADGITVGEVIRTMEGLLAPSPCARQFMHPPVGAGGGTPEETCVMCALWSEVREAITDILDQITFGQLAEREREQRALRGEAPHPGDAA